jgi:hypothetical protein
MTAGNVLIAEVGSEKYRHQFGGERWTIEAFGSSPPPALLLTLDLGDPRLGAGARENELPLVSRLDGESLNRQSYFYDPAGLRVLFQGSAWHVSMDSSESLPLPLPSRDLRLRPARADEDLGQTSKYSVQDTFLGGDAFIRVGGEPLWLTDAEDVSCPCGQALQFAACVGYENYARPSGIVAPTIPFFIGELALYFFVCFGCRFVVVISQPA